MNVEEFRDYCLSLPDVTEKMPFSAFRWAKDILAFYVKGKIFCFFDIEKFDMCTIKSDVPDEYTAKYGAVGKPFNMNSKYWMGVRFNDDMPDDMLKEVVKLSYDIVCKSSSKAH